jgi:hypothetical protein
MVLGSDIEVLNYVSEVVIEGVSGKKPDRLRNEKSFRLGPFYY